MKETDTPDTINSVYTELQQVRQQMLVLKHGLRMIAEIPSATEEVSSACWAVVSAAGFNKNHND